VFAAAPPHAPPTLPMLPMLPGCASLAAADRPAQGVRLLRRIVYILRLLLLRRWRHGRGCPNHVRCPSLRSSIHSEIAEHGRCARELHTHRRHVSQWKPGHAERQQLSGASTRTFLQEQPQPCQGPASFAHTFSCKVCSVTHSCWRETRLGLAACCTANTSSRVLCSGRRQQVQLCQAGRRRSATPLP
jgi:hypothetical protein